MKLNRLLERQVGKMLSPELMDHPDVKNLLSVVSESYNTYEKELEFSDRAFRLTEEEYIHINEKLSREIELKRKSISSMLEEVDESLSEQFRKNDEGLLALANYLKSQLSARKHAEKIFASLIDFDESAVLLRDAEGEIIHVNQFFFDLFSIPFSPDQVISKDDIGLNDYILSKADDPSLFNKRVLEILSDKKLVLKEKVSLNDGRIMERDFIPILIDGQYQGHLWKYVDKSELYKAKEEILDFRLSNETILNASLDGIVILNESQQVEFWNPRAENIFGWKEKEVLHADLQSILRLANPKVDWEKNINEFIGNMNNHNNTQAFELSLLHKNGHIVPVELFVLKIRQKGRFEYWCFVRDISERKMNEKRLVTSQRLLRQCQEIAHIGSWEIDLRKKKVQWTDELFHIRGIEPDSGKTSIEFFEKFIHPEDLEKVKTDIDECISLSIPFNIKYRIIRSDGGIRILQDIGQPVVDKSGVVIKFQGTSQDITEQEKISEDLALQKRFMDDILNNLPADIAVFDPEHNYLFVNPNGVASEQTRKWLIGKNDFDYCRERGVSESLAVGRRHIFNQAVSSGKTQEWIDQHRISNGEKKSVLRKLYPYFEKGKLKYVIGYGVDITDRKNAEDQLSDALMTVKKTNQELERFAYVASHDLQEPLRMVSNFLHLLEMKLREQLDETSRQYIDFALDGAERMKNLIQALLQYSRFGYNRESFYDTHMDEIMREVLHVLSQQIKDKNALVVAHPMPSLPIVRGQIMQLFQNLISNALKYNESSSPRVEIKCTESVDHWQFCVTDNGIGIEPRYFEKIFVIFQRLHSRSEYSGTGIGLSICAKIVEQHNGKIWVESEPGKGSTFFFTLSKHISS